MASPFICRGDNGNRQINFSSMGGDIGATALETDLSSSVQSRRRNRTHGIQHQHGGTGICRYSAGVHYSRLHAKPEANKVGMPVSVLEIMPDLPKRRRRNPFFLKRG